jgi:ABC-type multidrug transport system fused ATPase/permease subunit
MARQVLRQSGGDSVLRQAWRRFAAIDGAANRQQREFDVSQQWILALGLVAVALAIVQTVLPVDEKPDTGGRLYWLHEVLRLVLIVVPIGVSVLVAASNRFKPGKRWVLLRSAAESIKREIYRFRLRALGYEQDDTREKKLSEAIEDITRRLARTEANTTSLPVYAGAIPPPDAASERDDGLSQLSSDQYVRMRLEDQLAFYRRKTVALEQQLRWLQIGVLLAGAVGTLLAALGGAAVIWIALSTAVVGAVMTFLSYRQVETTLVNYNQTATDLENILSWWTALEPLEQVQRANIEALASHTEDVLANELAGWTQRMTDALEKLRDAQTKDGKDKDGNDKDKDKDQDDGDVAPAPTSPAPPAPPSLAVADAAGGSTTPAPAPQPAASPPAAPPDETPAETPAETPVDAPAEPPAAPAAEPPAAPPTPR